MKKVPKFIEPTVPATDKDEEEDDDGRNPGGKKKKGKKNRTFVFDENRGEVVAKHKSKRTDAWDEEE